MLNCIVSSKGFFIKIFMVWVIGIWKVLEKWGKGV